jgi:hypothetical protein
VPTGWPDAVHPPGSEGFEESATAWLLDVVPPDYRLHGVLVRHPVALAALAGHHLAACVEGARAGYRCARTELGKDLPPSGLVAVLEAYKAEGQRLVATAKAVDLVGRALRGDTFVPQLAGARDSQAHDAEPRGAEARDAEARDRGARARDREARRRGSETAGFETAGARTAGFENAGARTAGARTAGARTAGAGNSASRRGPQVTGPAAAR